MSVDHYENFPVASLLLPARLRPPVKAIYAFARAADDIADEGKADAATRLARLQQFRQALDACAAGRPVDDGELEPLFAPLGEAIRNHGLPLQAFHDLLDAFSQDVHKKRYADFDELLDYCRRSANPVGRLLLALYRADSVANLRRSDAICTSLQLINFIQDVAIDWEKQRIYLPADEMARFQVSADDIAAARTGPRWQALLGHQLDRARALMLEGAALALQLGGRIGWELRLVVLGGLRIVERIESAGHDVFRQRPQLGWRDWLLIGSRALNYRNIA